MIKLSSRSFEWGSRTYIMGILNITPDSFSGDGLIDTQEDQALDANRITDQAIESARKFVADGADIIDIGGESTRPGSEPVPLEDELERVIPVVRAISSELDTIISIDTYKSQVAEAAIESGAHMVNDVWGLRADPDLAQVISEHQVPVILMHNRSSWVHASIKKRLGGRYVGVEYDNLIEDIKDELMQSVGIALDAGISQDHIILDPGIGFGKTVEQNLELLNRVDEIRELGYPVLIGPSRKSFIGYTLDLPPDERMEGTAAAVAVAILRGADIIRVHDVGIMTRVARMTDAIVRH